MQLDRAGTGTAGTVSMLDAVTLTNTNRIVTSVRDGGNDLKLIVWDVDGTGNVTRRGSAGADSVSLVASCELSSDRLVTAVRDGAGNLKSIVWDVDGTGNVTRRGSAGAGGVSLLATCNLSPTRFVTAVRDGAGNLKSIVWDVDGAGNVTRRGSGSAGAVSKLDVCRQDGNTFVTAVRDIDGDLKVIVWDVDGTGNVHRRTDAEAGAVSEVAVAAWDNRVVTHVRDGHGDLKVIVWVLDGDTLRRTADTTEFGVREVSLGSPSFGTYRDASSNLRAVMWGMGASRSFDPSADPDYVRIEAEGGAGAVSEVRTAVLDRVATNTEEIDRFASVMRDGGGNLRIIVWAVTYPIPR